MKQIMDWKVIFKDEFGNEGIGILLPGCIVKGKLVSMFEEEIEIETTDVDITNMVITGIDGEKYLLLDTSRDYLKDIMKCIEIGLKERDGEER